MTMTREEATRIRDAAIAKANELYEQRIATIDSRENKLADGTDRLLVAIAKRKKAYELRQTGMMYKDIAKQIGCHVTYVQTLIWQHERVLMGESPTGW